MKRIITYPPVDLTKPFDTLIPGEIDIYFHFTNEIGKNTCKALCDNCYLQTVGKFSIPFDTASQIVDSLRNKGYNIGLTPPDTFSEGFLEQIQISKIDNTGGSAFRLQETGLSAWTSGKPLTLGNPFEKLELAYECGYRSITLSPHNAAETLVPFNGVTKGLDVQVAINNIKERNNHNPDKMFFIITTFTIGSYNNNIETMIAMAEWGIKNGIDLLRFNCFANFTKKNDHNTYEMSRDDIVSFGKNLLSIQERYLDKNLQFGLSEDWGDAFLNDGLLQYLDPQWSRKGTGRCRAGYKLFALVERENSLVLVGCVDNWAIGKDLGKVLLGPNGYDIQRNISAIEELRTAVINSQLYSCFGGVGYDRDSGSGFGVNSNVEYSVLGRK